MLKPLVPTLKIIIAIAFAGSLVVQIVIVPLFWRDLAVEGPWTRVALVFVAVLGVMMLQICGVCVWFLLTLVRQNAVFSSRAFRYVDVIIGAIGAAALLTLALGIVLATRGAAPGAVGLTCGAALVIAGGALLVVVMRALLAQAVTTDSEVRGLRSELAEVI